MGVKKCGIPGRKLEIYMYFNGGGREMRFKFILILFVIFAISSFNVVVYARSNDKIYGLTIDDSWYERVSLKEVVSSLKKLKTRPTARIVMSKDTEPKEYVKIFKAIYKVADVMAEPVDSYEMNLYEDVDSYKKRFKDSYKYLGKYVDIWEIGNEVNGEEWIKQDNFLVVDKIMAAYDVIKAKGGKAAVTFYYENPEYQRDMIKWIKTYIPKKMRKSLDYAFISYYEDDNEGYEPDWKSVFNKFEKLFPKSKIGIGECGNTAKTATDKSKIKMFNQYYSMPKYTKNYVGGYFWWNYVLDCIPMKNNKVYKAVCDAFKCIDTKIQ